MSVLGWVIELLPEWSPLGIASEQIADLLDLPVISSALGIGKWLDHYLPVSEAVTLLGYTLTALGIGWVYMGLMWVWRNLPGKAT